MKLRIVSDELKVLDATVQIDVLEERLGLFLKSSNGSKQKLNADYFEGLELLIKRLYKIGLTTFEVFLASKPVEHLSLNQRKVGKFELSDNYLEIRRKICRIQSKMKIKKFIFPIQVMVEILQSGFLFITPIL